MQYRHTLETFTREMEGKKVHRGTFDEVRAVIALVEAAQKAKIKLQADFEKRYIEYTEMLRAAFKEEKPYQQCEQGEWLENSYGVLESKTKKMLTRFKSWLRGQHEQFQFHPLIRVRSSTNFRPHTEIPQWEAKISHERDETERHNSRSWW